MRCSKSACGQYQGHRPTSTNEKLVIRLICPHLPNSHSPRTCYQCATFEKMNRRSVLFSHFSTFLLACHRFPPREVIKSHSAVYDLIENKIQLRRNHHFVRRLPKVKHWRGVGANFILWASFFAKVTNPQKYLNSQTSRTVPSTEIRHSQKKPIFLKDSGPKPCAYDTSDL